MIDISIVSGTYNRLPYLKKMVQSARQSIGNFYSLSYDFVLVDGGSQDGTQQWCNEQDDIKLIQHPKLLGAVKAFNDGAFAAQGQYIILANDDIEFLEDTIWLAYVYMQQHPDCGIGCFNQDRDRQDLPDDDANKWRIEGMPAVRNGKQVFAPYGQVCIVPKWLGDYVSWWCNEVEYEYKNLPPLHTYGGDNELSSQAHHLGLKVSAIPGTKIHDNEADDDLRKMNNISGGKDPRAKKGHHPDSWHWGKKWRDEKTGLVGAIMKDKPVIPYEDKIQIRERILYLPIFEPGWQVLKEQKRGLREALAKIGIVSEYDYMSRYHAIGKNRMMGELEVICQRFRPTLVLTQLHNGDMIGAGEIAKLRANCPGAKFANWNGDYWPEQQLNGDGLELAKSFDLHTVVNRDIVEKHQELGINTQFWQIGWEPEGRGYEPEEYHGVVFLASGYSPKRQELGKWLKKVVVYLGLYGSGWPDGWSKGENLYNFREACKIYRGAKLAIGDSQWPKSGFVSNRVMQILAAGNCALCHQWFRGMEKLGLIDGETCIIWQDFKELETKLVYYLDEENEPERKQIALNGEKLALEKHSFDARVQELFQMLDMGQYQKVESDWRW